MPAKISRRLKKEINPESTAAKKQILEGVKTLAGTEDARFSLCSTEVNCKSCGDDCCEHHGPRNYVFSRKEEFCCFEVYMMRCKVIESHDGKAEIMLTGYANDQQATFPGMGLWFQHHKKWGWRTIHKRIGRFNVKKGSKLNVNLILDAIEAGETLEGNWEMGSSESDDSFSLECSMPVQRQTLTVDCKKVKNALAGNVAATFQVQFAAIEISCCCGA